MDGEGSPADGIRSTFNHNRGSSAPRLPTQRFSATTISVNADAGYCRVGNPGGVEQTNSPRRAEMDAQKTESLKGVAVYECAMCRAPVTMTEKNGLGYCNNHWRVVHPQRLRRILGRGTPELCRQQRQPRHRVSVSRRIARSFGTATDRD
jgi:hypothetical protein